MRSDFCCQHVEKLDGLFFHVDVASLPSSIQPSALEGMFAAPAVTPPCTMFSSRPWERPMNNCFYILKRENVLSDIFTMEALQVAHQ